MNMIILACNCIVIWCQCFGAVGKAFFIHFESIIEALRCYINKAFVVRKAQLPRKEVGEQLSQWISW